MQPVTFHDLRHQGDRKGCVIDEPLRKEHVLRSWLNFRADDYVQG